MHAAVALVYVLVALPYSGPAKMGSLILANYQHVLFSLLQSRLIGLGLRRRNGMRLPKIRSPAVRVPHLSSWAHEQDCFVAFRTAHLE